MSSSIRSTLFGLLIFTAPSHGIEIELRYDYDTAGFFNAPGSREALRAAADYFESILHDSLLAIEPANWPGNTWGARFSDPSTGTTVTIENLVVPANTLVVYAGGRNLGGTAGQGGPGGRTASGFEQGWFDLLAARGQAGALATPKTDFGPWGGAITFNTTMVWNFSTSGPVSGQVPFMTIALHELGHLLGIGTAPSWTAKVSGTTFTGANAALAFGSNVPLQSGGGHWRDDGSCVGPNGHNPTNPNNVLSKAYGQFGAPHGFDQQVLMDPSSCSAGAYFKVMTDVDLAGLRDIGWQMEPPVKWITAQVVPAAPTFSFSWSSTSGITYRVQRSSSLLAADWTTLSTQAGDGSIQQFNTPNPNLSRAFYRLNTNPPVPSVTVMEPATEPAPANSEPVVVTDCHCCPSSCVE